MSPRPKRYRRMGRPPFFRGFQPVGFHEEGLPSIELLFEEYEALKLADYDNLSQEQAAEQMNVSRPTFTRIYESARKKIAKSFTESRAIVIEGGNVQFDDNWYQCIDCGSTFKKPVGESTDRCTVCDSKNIVLMSTFPGSGQRMGRSRGEGRGSVSLCVCPKCDKKVKHEPGVPCNTIVCPDCGVSMMREDSAHYINIRKRKK